MHETAIVEGLMRILLQQAAAHGVARIVSVTVKVGRLRAVEPAQLAGCFELFAQGTLAEGARLLVDSLPVRARCRDCAREFEVPRFRFVCPACGAGALDIVQGQELYIEAFEAGAP